MIEIHKQLRARKDLRNMWLYSFKRWGEKQADKYYDEITKGMELLADYPEIVIACDGIKKVIAVLRSKNTKFIIELQKHVLLSSGFYMKAGSSPSIFKNLPNSCIFRPIVTGHYVL